MSTKNMKVQGALLRASADDRTLTYRLLPFEADGFTNMGKIQASAGAVEIPEDVTDLPVNEEHDHTRPVGKFVNVEETEEGLEATIRLANTRGGDDALVLASEGLRTGISVEIAGAVIRSGRLVAGKLRGAGLVVRPAFADAQLMASDFGELDEETTDEVELTLEEQIAALEEQNQELKSLLESVEDEAADDSDAETINESEEEDMSASNSAVPSNLNAAKAADNEVTVEAIARAYKTRDARAVESLNASNAYGEVDLFAAQSPVKHSQHTANIAPSGWLGELWSGKTYTRKYAPLVSSGTLTNWKVEGYKFTALPTVADYSGDLSEINSTVTTTVPYSEEALRIAGGFKVDRKFSDFGDTQFLSALYEGATEDYARKSDFKVITKISSIATSVTAGTAPANVNPAMARIIDGVLSLIDFATPSYAIVAKDVYRSILLTREDDSLKYLSSSLGFEDGTVGTFRLIPSADVPNGTVIVGAKEAITLYELPGAPIRVSALDVSHGGQDEAVFGYYCLVVNDERGIVKVV